MGYPSQGASIDELVRQATKTAEEHGFTESTLVEDLMLICSEAAEALEDHRSGENPCAVYYEEKVPLATMIERALCDAGIDKNVGADDVKKFSSALAEDCGVHKIVVRHAKQRPHWRDTEMLKPCGIPMEVADIVIRCFHFAGKHGFSLQDAIEEKMAYNATREFRHGKKL